MFSAAQVLRSPGQPEDKLQVAAMKIQSRRE